MRKHVLVVLCVAVAALALVAPASAQAASAPARSTAGSCTVYVQTQAGPFSGWITRSSKTSCPFARNVASASLRAIIRMGGAAYGPFTVKAYSPVTRATYRVNCRASGDIWSGVSVDCRAGIGARVGYMAWSN